MRSLLNMQDSQSVSSISEKSQKKFSCEWVDVLTGVPCDRKFNQRGNLIQHMRMHRGEKLFECDVCGQYFSTGSNRNDHQRRHNNVKPYKCEYPGCTLDFYRRYQMLNHQEKAKHGGLTKSVETCKKETQSEHKS